MHRGLFPGTVIPAAVAAGLWLLPAQALATRTVTDHHSAPDHKVSHGASSNWSGYAVAGFGPYTSVSSSWTQPAVDCKKTPTGYSAFWIGLDGDTDETVEQTGSEGECSHGTAIYFAWFEMYPRYPVNFPTHKYPVAPGDVFTSSVSSLGAGKFELTLADTTQGWSRTVTKPLKSAQLASAEAIAEAPSGEKGVLPLADFGSVAFSELTVDGSLVTESTPGVEAITMETAKGVEKATPSAISDGNFTDTWDSK